MSEVSGFRLHWCASDDSNPGPVRYVTGGEEILIPSRWIRLWARYIIVVGDVEYVHTIITSRRVGNKDASGANEAEGGR